MKKGDWFRIDHKGHFAHGEVHKCDGLPRIRVKGEPPLDMGRLVQFTIPDFYRHPSHHVVPVEWTVPCERPSMAKRVARQGMRR